jgi:HAD superfamily hydrolase (TIGR01509 family)
MTEQTVTLGTLDPDDIDVVLCDADGTLFDSEEAAFAVSTSVTNRLLTTLEIDRSYTPPQLRRWAAGRNFRSTASALADQAGVAIESDMLERWVVAERTAVVEELAMVLRPSAAVREVLEALSSRVRLGIVTSSATARLDSCVTATGLADIFPVDVRFSAEDSLPTPTSKPDPAIYQFAGERLGVAGTRGLAVEDAVAGVRSAVSAGFPTIGMLQFVPIHERAGRTAALLEAGAVAVVPSWGALLSIFVKPDADAIVPSWQERAVRS